MIYVFFADGFEEMEGLCAVDILRRSELNVRSVGIGGKEITGSHGIKIVTDLSDSEVSMDNLEMIVLPGGLPGTLNLEKSEIVQAVIDFSVNNNLWIGAICAAPSILGHKGLLNGKKACCAVGFETQLLGAKISTKFVETDGKFITAQGAGVSIEFALKLVACLLGEKRAEILRDSLRCRTLI